MKTFLRLQGIVRGFSNHRRIQIMDLLDRRPELSVEDTSRMLRVRFKTAAMHLQRLAISGLVIKRHDGRSVRHKLTDRGARVINFVRTLQ